MPGTRQQAVCEEQRKLYNKIQQQAVGGPARQ
jgi:hypothetical protein